MISDYLMSHIGTPCIKRIIGFKILDKLRRATRVICLRMDLAKKPYLTPSWRLWRVSAAV